MGTGAFANLRMHAEFDRLAAIVISHMHADHFIDLIPLRYALRYGRARGDRKLPLYLPPGGERMLVRLCEAFADEGAGDFLGAVFDVHTYDPARALKLGDGVLTFAHTTHYIPAFAVRYEQRHGAQSVTYSADTAPNERVIKLARGTDLFLCEATLLADADERGARGHSSAREAAEMAHRAGVGCLCLTHYGEHATASDLDVSARQVFSGEVIVAEDHEVYTIGTKLAAR
jgi:ribonuclease BN (tRNA processing enzyme)